MTSGRYQGIEFAETGVRQTAIRRRVSAWVITPLAFASLTTTAVTTFNALKWRGTSEAARRIAADPHADRTTRINAAVSAALDADATIVMIQALADSSDPALAAQGNALLRAIHERSER